jgi:hypothetical protein
MDIEKLTSSIALLERKVKLLLGEHKAMKEEVVALKTENQELTDILDRKDVQLNDFHNKYKISKIVGNLGSGEGDSTEIKKQIDGYIKEIDRCIIHLSQG